MEFGAIRTYDSPLRSFGEVDINKMYISAVRQLAAVMKVEGSTIQDE